jgi:hypothetical protein
MSVTLWMAESVTEELENLLYLNTEKKLWHLGRMPPLMVVLHEKWHSFKRLVVDGKGATCETLNDIKDGELIIHPFKHACTLL